MSRLWIIACLAFLGLAEPTLAQRDLAKLGSDALLRLQIMLDNHHFGVGPLDGRAGGFTKKAAVWHNIHDGAAPEDMGRLVMMSEREVSSVHASHRVEADHLRFIGPVPKDIPEQARLSFLTYRTMLELIAERYHASEELLRRLNPKRNLLRLEPGDVVTVPNVRFVFEIESVPAQQFPREEFRSSCYAVVDTRERMATIFTGTTPLAAFPITPAKPRYVPLGRWRLTTMGGMPPFRWDERMLKEGRRGPASYLLPPGPNSLIGVLWAGTDRDGIGLHGTDNPEAIGRTMSAGCVRFTNWDAMRLPNFLRPGSEVIIR